MKRFILLGIVVLFVTVAAAWFGLPQQTAGAVADPAAVTTFSDEFSKTILKPSWSWVRENPSNWSLTAKPGFLRIVTEQGGLLGGSNNNKNLLLRNAPTGKYAISTRVLYKPTTNFQIAGLLVYQDDDNFLWLGRAYASGVCAPPTCYGNAIYFDHEEGGTGVGSNFATLVTANKKAYLKIERNGKRYTGYYSEDGVTWVKLGKHIVGDSFTPKVGLGTGDSNQGAPALNADFDFFRIE